jgi:carboxymethylenebutenolidase
VGTLVSFAANGRSAGGYLALPPGGTGPGLVVLQEWWGLVDHIKALCDRFAAAGFVALAPDLYHGEVAKSPDAAGKLLMALNIVETGKELRGAAAYLHGHQAVIPKKVGVLGFCMGGQLALFAAQEHGDLFAAAVDFYGIHPKVSIDPTRVRIPVLAHFGARDESVPVASAHALAAAIRSAGGHFEDHEYGAGHAFFNDTRPQVYDATCAALAWDRTLAFLRQHLT